MIYKEIFSNFVIDAPRPPQAPSGSRQGTEKAFMRAHLAAKVSPGVNAGRGLKLWRRGAHWPCAFFARR
jgi:hypothetical protein